MTNMNMELEIDAMVTELTNAPFAEQNIVFIDDDVLFDFTDIRPIKLCLQCNCECDPLRAFCSDICRDLHYENTMNGVFPT